MRTLFRLIVLLPALTVAALALLAYLAIEAQPTVTAPAEASTQEMERAERLLREHDPRRQTAGGYRTLALTREDLDVLVGYLARRLAGAATRVSLGPAEITLTLTLRLPDNPFGPYLNAQGTFRTRGVDLVPGDVRLGHVRLPDALVGWLWARAETRLSEDPGYRLARESIRDIRVGPDAVRVRYEWRPEILAAARDRLVPAAERARLAAYQRRLAERLASAPRAYTLPLASLLGQLAGTPLSDGEDPVAENSALLAVLAAHALGKDLRVIAPDAAAPSRPPPHLTLRGRVDFAQHFLASAAVTAAAGSALSDAVGLSKELADARGGSGFSFTDLAADRAGTRFGETATASAEGARAWRARFTAGVTEADFMPAIDDLPEFLPEAEFRRRFGEVGSPTYQAVHDEIERRVAACPFYR